MVLDGCACVRRARIFRHLPSPRYGRGAEIKARRATDGVGRPGPGDGRRHHPRQRTGGRNSPRRLQPTTDPACAMRRRARARLHSDAAAALDRRERDPRTATAAVRMPAEHRRHGGLQRRPPLRHPARQWLGHRRAAYRRGPCRAQGCTLRIVRRPRGTGAKHPVRSPRYPLQPGRSAGISFCLAAPSLGL